MDKPLIGNLTILSYSKTGDPETFKPLTEVKSFLESGEEITMQVSFADPKCMICELAVTSSELNIEAKLEKNGTVLREGVVHEACMDRVLLE